MNIYVHVSKQKSTTKDSRNKHYSTTHDQRLKEEMVHIYGKNKMDSLTLNSFAHCDAKELKEQEFADGDFRHKVLLVFQDNRQVKFRTLRQSVHFRRTCQIIGGVTLISA